MILRIFMHRMHSIKNLRCLVGILENTKCISDQRRKEAIRDSKGPSSPHFTPTRIAEGQGVILACRVASPFL